jgi:hypothetical protein
MLQLEILYHGSADHGYIWDKVMASCALNTCECYVLNVMLAAP